MILLKTFTKFGSYFSLSIFLLLSVNLCSQNWLKDGQQWTYLAGGGFPNPADGLRTLTVLGDTVIANVDCKILANQLIDAPSNPRLSFAYTEEEAVYAYYSSEEGFIKIYDFSMAIGDSLVFPNNKKYRVDSIGTMDINGQNFRFQHISYYKFAPGLTGWNGTYLIIEGIGFIGKFFSSNTLIDGCSYFFTYDIPCDAALDGQSYRLECFLENDFLYDPNNRCSPNATQELIQNDFRIYPNPATDYFTIESSSNTIAAFVTLYDLMGRTVYRGKVLNSKVNIRNMKAQSYIIKIMDQNGIGYFSRIVIGR